MAKTTLPQPITMLDTKKAKTTITPPQSLMNITMMTAHTADFTQLGHTPGNTITPHISISILGTKYIDTEIDDSRDMYDN